MSCSALNNLPRLGAKISVNGVGIAREAIAEEIQHHPAKAPIDAWHRAAEALVIRELLKQEVARQNITAEPVLDADGRRESDEEAAIRVLLEQNVQVPQADEAACRHYYENNRRRFRSGDLFEPAHILLAAAPGDLESREGAKRRAFELIAVLREEPSRFGELAREHSACPSGQQGGNLGQIGPGQTVLEFEAALARLGAGEMTHAPIESRFGFHIIRLERKIEGRELPFEAVHQRIADYLAASAYQRALAQYVAVLAAQATITGVELSGADAQLVQ